MEIRCKETVKRYNEAKKFVEQYEHEYLLAIIRNSFFDADIWDWRHDIQKLLDRLKELGMLNEPNHPYNKQIENRRRYIKEKLKEKYYDR